jgi:26S proteasome regulatory subunit N13
MHTTDSLFTLYKRTVQKMAAPLVQFKCGRLILDHGLLKPDTRKGLIRVTRDELDLLHFQWGERDAAGTLVGEPEVDQVVFPGEAAFEKIPRPGSRVFTLKFAEEADRALFFWAQEPAAENDDALVQAVNLALSSVLDGMDDGIDEDGAQLGSDQPLSMELPEEPNATPATDSNPRSANPGSVAGGRIGGGGGAGTGGGSSTFEAGGIGASQLAAALGNILSGSGVTTGAERSTNNTTTNVLSLGEVLKADRIAPLLNNTTLVERLAPYLPEEHRTPEAMAEIINSPQFKHQLDVLTQALATGQIDTSHFGLGSAAFGVAEFLKAIEREAEKEKKENPSEEQKEEGGS